MQHPTNANNRILGNAGGFTLIELMIAIVILGFGILGLVYAQVNALQTTTLARQRTQCTVIGADRFEKMMMLPYDDGQLTPNTTTTVVDDPYTIQWQVSAENTPIQNVKTVTVTTSWTTKGQQRSETYVYYKADPL
jgi:type IV pilus modification protein PilV